MPNYPYDQLATPLDTTNLEKANGNWAKIAADIASVSSASQLRDGIITTDYNEKINKQNTEYTSRLDLQYADYIARFGSQRAEYTNGFQVQKTRIDNIVSEISDEAFDSVVDSAKLIWLSPVSSFSSLSTSYPNALEGNTSMARDTGTVYRFNGTSWVEIQKIDPTAVNEVDTRLSNKLSEKADLSALVWDDINADNTVAFNNALLTGKKIVLKNGTLTIKGRIRLDQAPNNSYDIEGCGESTVLNFVGVTAGLYDKYGSQGNENYHLKRLSKFKLQGDGTNVGFDFSSLCLFADNLLFDGFERGLYVHNGGYSSKFVNCFFKRNKYGIYFGDLATTIEFDTLYCSVHNNQLGAAIYFDKPVEMIKIQGIIQANRAAAIWYGPNFGGDVEFDVYFELNGDKNVGVYSIRNDAVAGEIKYVNSKIPANQSGTWISGDYQLGYNVSCYNCRLTAVHTVKNSLALSDCYLDSEGTVMVSSPTKTRGFTLLGSLLGPGGANGLAIRQPAILKQNTLQLTNKHLNPFSTSGVSVLSTGANAPAVAVDTTNKLSGYNSTAITFVNGVAGSAGNNSVLLLGNFQQVSMNAGQRVVCSVMLRANQPGNVIINVTGSVATPIFTSVPLTTSWRKFTFIGKNSSTSLNQGNAYLFNATGMTNFVVNVTALAIYEYVPNELELLNEIIEGNLTY